MFVGGAGDERVGRHSAGRVVRRAGLRTGWQAGPSEQAAALAFARARWLALERRARASRRVALPI